MPLILFFLGIFISVILAVFNYRKNPATIYLSLFFFSVSIYCLIHYTLFYSNSATLIALFFKANIGFVTLLPGPLLYFYTKHTVTDQLRLKPVNWLHFAPVVLIFIGGVPNYFSPWTEKLQMASDFINNNKSLISYYHQSSHYSNSFSLIFFGRPVYIFTYFILSVTIFLKNSLKHKESHVFSHQKFMYSWLAVLFILFFFLIISHSALLFVHYFANRTTIFHLFFTIQAVGLIGIMGLLFSPFLFPGILYGLPRVSNNERQITEEPSTGLPDKTVEYQNQPGLKLENETSERKLEENYLKTIGCLIDTCMKEHQPYLNPGFNMAMLSVLISIPVHHLAYYFKEIKNQSISEFRNSWRVEYAKKIIMEGKSKNLTLEAIAGLSGFSSRNTFLVSFKKYEKMTPKEFLESISY